jgi:hypothetical protein
MSTAALTRGPGGVIAGWETEGKVIFGELNGAAVREKVPAPGERPTRKYPALATNQRGETLRAWTEGMSWKRGGAAAWQVYDAKGNPVGEAGRADGVPADGTVATFARPDGAFVVVF